MNFNIFVGTWTWVTKNVTVNGNSTARLAITPKMGKEKIVSFETGEYVMSDKLYCKVPALV